MRRHELTAQHWAALAPLLPPERPRTGRPNQAHRTWRDVPERYGPWSTLYSRFRRWRLAGVWDRVLAAVQTRAGAAGQLDWTVHFVAGTVIRAHQHAAGAKGGTRRRRRSGAARAASRRRSISARKAAANR
jgi:transposase